MKRALVLVEGQTEERFVKEVLQSHLLELNLGLIPTLIRTKEVTGGKNHTGGLASFGQFDRDATRLLYSSGNALVTTMLDYYRLPQDFPGVNNASTGSPLSRVRNIESAIHEHYGSPQYFLPYLSLHEFEALLFCSPDELPKAMTQSTGAQDFANIRSRYSSPEDINDGPTTAPSKRILALYPTYRKVVNGVAIAKRIGLQAMRAQCLHFDQWIIQLEAFAKGS